MQIAQVAAASGWLGSRVAALGGRYKGHSGEQHEIC